MRVVITLLLLALLFSGCEKKYTHISRDANMTLKTPVEEALSERAMDYWEAFATKQFDEAYSYELPFQRYTKSLKWYKQFNKGNEKNYTLVQKEIVFKDADRAIIKTLFQMKNSHYMMSDKWYLVNGQWYHKMKTTLLPTLEKW